MDVTTTNRLTDCFILFDLATLLHLPSLITEDRDKRKLKYSF